MRDRSPHHRTATWRRRSLRLRSASGQTPTRPRRSPPPRNLPDDARDEVNARGETMRRDDVDDETPYVIIEDRSSDIGPFLLGALVGAGLALLLAPHSGPQTRAL